MVCWNASMALFDGTFIAMAPLLRIALILRAEAKGLSVLSSPALPATGDGHPPARTKGAIGHLQHWGGLATLKLRP